MYGMLEGDKYNRKQKSIPEEEESRVPSWYGENCNREGSQGSSHREKVRFEQRFEKGARKPPSRCLGEEHPGERAKALHGSTPAQWSNNKDARVAGGQWVMRRGAGEEIGEIKGTRLCKALKVWPGIWLLCWVKWGTTAGFWTEELPNVTSVLTGLL